MKSRVNPEPPAWHGCTSDGEPPANAATFKWSRENGSVVYPIRNVATDSTAKTTTVQLENLGRDERFGVAINDWVELVNDVALLQNVARSLLRVTGIDRSAQNSR